MWHYRFKTIIVITAPIEEVWKTLTNFETWPKWWKVLREIKILDKKINKKSLYAYGGYLFYNLSIYAKTIEDKQSNRIKISILGDLQGSGEIVVTKQNSNTVITVFWSVSVAKIWMKIASIFARFFFVYSHSIAMDWLAKGLTKKLHAKNLATKHLEIRKTV